VSDIYQPAFWDNEDRLFWLFISEEYAKLISNGVAGGIDGLPPQVRALVNWDVINNDVLRYAREYRYGDIKNIDDTTREFVQEAVTDWIQSGDPLDELVRMLKPKFDKVRAEMIAATEVTRLYAEGNRIAWESSGMVGQVRWMTAEDELVCPICGRPDGHAGKVYDLTDTANHPPAHPRCVLPGQYVLPVGEISAAAKSFYSGRVVEILTIDGNCVTVTPNHAILTQRGWVKAAELVEGNDFVYTTISKGESFTINPDDQKRPAMIENIYSALSESVGMATIRMPAAAEDFNGDGKSIKGDIDIVVPYGSLLRNSVTRGTERIGKNGFNKRGIGFLLLLSKRLRDFIVMAKWNATNSIMRGLHLLFSLFLRHSLPLDLFGLRLIAWVYSSLYQMPAKTFSTNSCLACQFILRFASDITLSKVTKITYNDFTGHVYDLQCDDYGLYICNDIITHNCRCWIQPIVDVDMVGERIGEALDAD